MSTVIPFRKFTRRQLVELERMHILVSLGEKGRRLHAFILDAYDDHMGEEAETPEEFAALCAAVFEDLEDDRLAEIKKEEP